MGIAAQRSTVPSSNPLGNQGAPVRVIPLRSSIPAPRVNCSTTISDPTNAAYNPGSPAFITGSHAANGGFTVCQNDTTGYSAGSLNSTTGAFTPSNAYYVEANVGTSPNGSRNTLPIRPIDDFDLTLAKRLSFGERYSLEISAGAFNVLNHAQYQPGNLDNVNGPSFTASYNYQTVSSSFFNHPEKEFLNNARSMQLSGKINF